MNSPSHLTPPPGLPAKCARSKCARSRRGAVYLAELILVMPIFMIMLLAVVQFGIFFTSLQAVSFASRVGAETASQGTTLAVVDTAVGEQLLANGIDEFCTRLLDNNSSQETCPCNATNFNTPVGSYVQVTVCVPQTELMPNLLAPFGYDITNAADITCATVMRQEMDP